MANYTLYLVTDSTMVPAGHTVAGQVQQAIDNGATMVQLREKNIDTVDFVKRAQEVLAVTRPRGVPLIINDRIDVALAVDADGVHVGQEDMPAAIARRLIGDKILGVSCGTPEETQRVCEEGVADYVGLGTLYPTSTKDVKRVVGPMGIRQSLRVLQRHNKSHRRIRCVAIGGINQTNASKVMFQCNVEGQRLDGVAVVSCVMAAPDAAAATRVLLSEVRTPFQTVHSSGTPLVHHITNNVVKNFCANVTLAVGGSPIMSELRDEFAELAALEAPVALVVNLGTPSPELMQVFLEALSVYNRARRPIVLDPVAAGASAARLAACKALLNAGQFSVIKGNVGEILALASLTGARKTAMRGVDAVGELDAAAIEELGRAVASEFKAVVVVTGRVNYIVGDKTVAVPGGSALMGAITGLGCALGSVIGRYIANGPVFDATVEAVRRYNDAGRRVAATKPGTFQQLFLDSLY